MPGNSTSTRPPRWRSPPGDRRIGRSLRRAAAAGRHRQPAQLRINADAVQFARDMAATGKPVAAICHGPWTLVEAGVVEGRRMTSWPSLRTDLRNAGAEVVDGKVVVDGQFTTSRSPADQPAFCRSIVEQFARSPEPPRRHHRG